MATTEEVLPMWTLRILVVVNMSVVFHQLTQLFFVKFHHFCKLLASNLNTAPNGSQWYCNIFSGTNLKDSGGQKNKQSEGRGRTDSAIHIHTNN